MEEDAPIWRLDYVLPEQEIEASSMLLVAPGEDIFMSRLQVSEGAPGMQFYWYADPDPEPRRLGVFTSLTTIFEPSSDFACFQDWHTRMLVHFRPAAVSSMDWNEARALVALAAPSPRWERFGDGVYLAFRAPYNTGVFSCGTGNEPNPPYRQAMRGSLVGSPAALGRTVSCMALSPIVTPEGWEGVLFGVAGRNHEAVSTTMANAISAGPGRLLENTRVYWRTWLEGARLTGAAGLRPFHKRLLLQMAAANSQYDAGVSRRPAGDDAYAVTWPEHAAWCVIAYDQVGKTRAADSLARFLLTAIPTPSGTGSRPAGAQSIMLTADAMSGAPDFIVSLEAPAWTLQAAWAHGSALPAEEAVIFWDEYWSRIEAAADFLAAWEDPRTGMPLPAFSSYPGHDIPDPGRLLCLRMGIHAAIQIAETLGEACSGWVERLQTVDILLDEHFPPDSAAWKDYWRSPLWLTARFVPEDRAWDALFDYRLQSAKNLPMAQRTATLCDAAWIARGNAVRLSQVRRGIEQCMMDCDGLPPGDTSQIAMLVTALGLTG